MVVWKEGHMQVIQSSNKGTSNKSRKKKRRYPFIAQNLTKHWDEGHTHVGSKKRAIDICRHVENGTIPKNYDTRCLGSLFRLARDAKYKQEIEDLLEVRRQKGEKPRFQKRTKQAMSK